MFDSLLPLNAVSFPNSGKFYAVWNPIPQYSTRPDAPGGAWTDGRNPYVMAESSDGRNFSRSVILENDETRGFCYSALYFLDEKTMLLAYCNGGAEQGSCLNSTMIRKVVLE